MKKTLKIILPIILAIAIVISIGWYFFQYDKAFTRDVLLSWARGFDDSGNYPMAGFFYNMAYRQAGNDDAIAIEIARQYKERGNYTQAENTLSNAISDGGTPELYIELCKTYVEQDKLMDAVNMLNTIPDPAIKKKLDSKRPSAPVDKAHPSGNYDEYIALSFSSPDGKVYANFKNQYPSTKKNYHNQPVTLGDGTTVVQTLAVASNGLVSPLRIYSYSVTQVSKAITLEDPAIDRVVRQMLGVDDKYELYTDDLLNFEAFFVPQDAKTLVDLYYMPHLKTLVIKDCEVPDLASTANLRELEDLTVSNVTLSGDDIQTIGSLTELKYLTLEGCGISNVSALGALTKLKYLDLNNNAIGNISFIKNLKKLTIVNMSNNALTDLTEMGGLTALEQLTISYNSLKSLAPLAGCINLRALEVTNNQLTDLSGLETLKRLGLLYASSNTLKDISALAQTPEMADLDLSRNMITDLTALAGLPKLYKLDFSHNDVTVLPRFSESSILNEINGAYNNISSVGPLTDLPLISILKLSYNASLTTIDPLLSCESLTQIDVLNTGVTDITAFKGKDIVILYNLA